MRRDEEKASMRLEHSTFVSCHSTSLQLRPPVQMSFAPSPLGECCEIGSGDGEIPQQVMDHLLLHQVDVAELVEPLADNGPTLKSAHQSLSRGRFSFYETLTLFE